MMEAIVARHNLKKALARVARNEGAPTPDGAVVAVDRNPQEFPVIAERFERLALHAQADPAQC
jgi:hypothetical protein